MGRKLLLVVPMYRPDGAPTPVWIAPLHDGYDIRIIGWRWDYKGSDIMGVNWRIRLKNIPYQLELVSRALWVGRHFDVVIFYMPPPGIVVAFLVRLLRIRYGKIVLVSLIDYDKTGLRRMERWLIHWALPQVSAVTVTAEDIRRRLAQLHGEYILSRTYVLPDRVWGENYDKPEPPVDQNFPYVFAGGASLRDWPTLAATVRQLPDVNFVVIGSSRDATFHKISWPSNVRVMLDQLGAEFWRWLNHAAIVVLPIRDSNDAVGLLFIGQSFFAGKAIIATDSGIARQYIVNGRNGILVPHGNFIVLVEKIRWLLSHDEERRQLECGAASSRNQFTTRAFSKGLQAVVDSLWT